MVCNGANEYYSNTTPVCPPLCEFGQCDGEHEYYSETPPICPAVCGLKSTCSGNYSQPTCLCDNGYALDIILKKCVICPKCKEHEHYASSKLEYPVNCSGIITCEILYEHPTCVCDEGFATDDNTGKCVKCEGPCKEPDEHLSDTTPKCPSTCDYEIECQDFVLEPSCQCDRGFARNEFGKCRKCPQNNSEENSSLHEIYILIHKIILPIISKILSILFPQN